MVSEGSTWEGAARAEWWGHNMLRLFFPYVPCLCSSVSAPLSLPLPPPMSRPPICLPPSLRRVRTLVTLITAESSGSTLLDTKDCSAVTTCTAHQYPPPPKKTSEC
jgi:hypothetical protein